MISIMDHALIKKARPYFRRLEALEQQFEQADAQRREAEAELAKINTEISRLFSGKAASQAIREYSNTTPQNDSQSVLLRVAEVIRTIGKPVDAKMVASKLGVKVQVARVRLVRATEAKLVRRVSRGKYTVPKIQSPQLPRKKGRHPVSDEEFRKAARGAQQ